MYDRVKHLELIQGIINRLANNCFLIKGWMTTVALAGFGYAMNQNSHVLVFLTLLATMLFWFLDSYYLRQERLFRKLYEECAESETIKSFSMDVKRYDKMAPSVIRTMISYPTVVLYFSNLIGAVALTYFLKF